MKFGCLQCNQMTDKWELAFLNMAAKVDEQRKQSVSSYKSNKKFRKFVVAHPTSISIENIVEDVQRLLIYKKLAIFVSTQRINKNIRPKN